MIGTGELLIILFVVLILFGGKKLPELARSIGLGIREFKKACHGIEDTEIVENKNSKTTNQDSIVVEVEPENKKDPHS